MNKRELNKLWLNFNENSSQFNASLYELNNCDKIGSKYVLHSTPNIKDYYIIGSRIGRNDGKSKVFQAINKQTKQHYAVKYIDKWKYGNDLVKTKELFDQIRYEILVSIKVCDHPNIVTYRAVFENEIHVIIIMDLCDGGSLYHLMKKQDTLSEQKVSNYMKQMLASIHHIHESNIAHFNVKPENFLIKKIQGKDVILLTDFRLSKVCNFGDYFNKIVGTLDYVSPEMMDGNYNKYADLWSLGIIAFEMLFGFTPFHDDNNFMHTFVKISRFEDIVDEFPAEKRVSNMCKDFVSKILIRQVERRLTAGEALEHPFIQRFINNSDNALVLNPNIKNLFKVNKKYGYSSLQNEIINMLEKCDFLHDFQMEWVKYYFKYCDKNGDNYLSLDELKLVVGNDVEMNDNINWIYSVIDVNGDGKISLNEFIRVRLYLKLIENEWRLKRIFDILDTDKNGSISPSEFEKAFISFSGIDVNDESSIKGINDKINTIVKECDINGDGCIDYNEFIHAFVDITL